MSNSIDANRYIRARVSLLTDEDAEKLRPDSSLLEAAAAALEAPVDLPPTPIFNRPPVVQPNPHFLVAQAHQQQLMQQQQRHMEQFQQYQLLAQQQQQVAIQQQAALAAQQQQAAQQQSQGLPVPNGQPQVNGAVSAAPVANGQQPMAPPNGTPGSRPAAKRPPSSNGSMAPPNQPRPSLSPTNPMHPSQLPNGQSPQMLNHVLLPNGKQMVQPNGGAPLTPAMQQMLAAKILQAQTAQNAGMQLPNGEANGHFGANGTAAPQPNGQVTQQQLLAIAQSHGFGNDIQAFLAAKQKAAQLANAKQAQLQQAQLAQLQAQQQLAQVANGAGQGTPGNGNAANGGAAPFSPTMAQAQMQLKLPAKAQARLAGTPGVQPQAQRT